MEMQQIIEQAEQNIRQALEDYGKHTDQKDVLEDVSDRFIERLARDSSWAKNDLRNLFKKSPVWDERIDALVINGTRTHDPDYRRIRDLGLNIFYSRIANWSNTDYEVKRHIREAIEFFASPDTDTYAKEAGIQAINILAPKAYTPTKKLSRVFKALCVALEVADETAGSEFQRLYAQFADELSAKKISFKLYVSINPAHFLTMSNPKNDQRGSTLTSCHSFNSTEYQYNSGCIGYARDEVSFIVFTVDDPSNPESLNNRKTTRQIFAYQPGNGLLLQSRMYNTSGGTRGAQEDSKLYRDLVQREISMLEGVPNLWKTYPYCGEHDDTVEPDMEFGGYKDWEYSEFAGRVSIRADHEGDWEPLKVGASGLCIECAGEIGSEGWLYCGDGEKGICEENGYRCDECSDFAEETFAVYDRNGHVIYVCEDCRSRYYTRCSECEDYYPNDDVRYVDGRYICEDCFDEHYFYCEICGEYHHEDDEVYVRNERGEEIRICDSCCDKYYTRCDCCEEYFSDNNVHPVFGTYGDQILVCDDCLKTYQECPSCGEHVSVDLECGEPCPLCGAVVVEEENEEVSA